MPSSNVIASFAGASTHPDTALLVGRTNLVGFVPGDPGAPDYRTLLPRANVFAYPLETGQPTRTTLLGLLRPAPVVTKAGIADRVRRRFAAISNARVTRLPRIQVRRSVVKLRKTQPNPRSSDLAVTPADIYFRGERFPQLRTGQRRRKVPYISALGAV